jgi:3-deoxy-D-manno-octulosonic-acid transferase
MRQDIGGRPVFVAASTHPGEEGAILAAHAAVRNSGRQLLTILAPRHPERGEALAAEIAAAGLRFARRSAGEPIGRDTEVYLADTIGEMGLWYRLADAAFLGGSIVARGGQNPIEPVKLGVPVLHGGHVENFRVVYDALAAADAVSVAGDAAALAAVVMRLTDEPQERLRMAERASACIAPFSGALDRTLDHLRPYLAQLRDDDVVHPRS